MPGIKALRKVQLGQEATAGTNVAATAIWRGMGMLQDNRETTFVEEDIGILGGTNRTYVARTGGEITLEGDATFQQLPYVFQSGIYETTPTTDASSADIWTWNVQNASSDPIATTDLQTYTIEAGDNQQAEYMNFAFCREFSLSGNIGEAIQVSATMEGRTVATTDFTTGISIPTVESILFTKGALYSDPSSDTAGTSQLSKTLLSMDFNMTTGWMAYTAADAQTYFSDIKRVAEEMTLQVTFEHNASAVTEKGYWRNETERVLQLKFTGSALTTTDAGATYDTYTFVMNLYGKWETFDAISDENGNDVVSGTFRVGYSSTAAAKATFIVANESATLT